VTSIRASAALCVASVIAGVLVAAGAACSDRIKWRMLEPGLELADMSVSLRDGRGPGSFSVLRIDLDRFDVEVLSAGLLGLKNNPTADKWAREYSMTAVVNAGMYQKDHRRSVGYLKAGGRVGNGHRHRKYKSMLVSGPLGPGDPQVAILDSDCDDVWKEARAYANVVQGIRMLDCKGGNVWKPGGRAYRQVAVAVDSKGQLLFIYRGAPSTSYRFVEMVRASGLGVERMMYLEGGTEASLYIRSGDEEIRKGGVNGLLPDFWKGDSADAFLPLPNVIAIKKKAARSP